MSGAERMVSTRWTDALCFVSHYPVHGPLPHWPHIIPAFLRGRFAPFLMVPSVSLITVMWLLISSFSQTCLWGRWWLCLHLAWLFCLPGCYVLLGSQLLCVCFTSHTKPSCCWWPGWLSVHILRTWCLCLLDFWHSPAWCSGCLEKEVPTSMAEKTSSSTNMGGHGESIWKLGALQGEQGKEEQRLWLKQGHWLCSLWCCRDWTRLGEKAGWRINSSKAGE